MSTATHICSARYRGLHQSAPGRVASGPVRFLMSHDFPLPTGRQLLAWVHGPLGLADYWVGTRGRRQARRRRSSAESGVVVAVRTISNGIGPHPEIGWGSFDVEVSTPTNDHAVRVGSARQFWFPSEPGPVTIRMFALANADKELQASFDLTPSEPVVLVEVRPRMIQRRRTSEPQSIVAYDSRSQIVAEAVGSRLLQQRRLRDA